MIRWGVERILSLFGLFSIQPTWRRKICATDQDVNGPFYRIGAPFRIDLAEGYEGYGEQLIVSGQILSLDCMTPVEGAIIDLWHASPEGEYDMIGKNYLFRARLLTDKMGRYTFYTLLPKGYRDGTSDNPKLIHYTVTADKYHKLITHMYFQDDPNLPENPYEIEKMNVKRAVPLIRTHHSAYLINFDLVLSNI